MNGVRTIEDLRLRCVVDEITGCWLWRGAFTQGVGAVWLPELGKTRTIRSAAMFLSGKPIKKGHRIYLKCIHSDCCNPAHCNPMTPAAFGKAQAASDRLKGNPTRLATCIRLGRKNSRLTPELAQEIRESSETGLAIAARLGVSRSVVSKIRTNKAWNVAAMPGASVFTWFATERKAA